MDNLKNDQLKNAILQNIEQFNYPKIKRSCILFEKKINQHTIADCLIMSEHNGIIGCEIKTQHDTLKRLPHQLNDYTKVCKYTYVICQDKQLKKVQQILKNYPQVGLISYEEFDNRALMGKLKEAQPSTRLNTNIMIKHLLWKSELIRVVNSLQLNHNYHYYNQYSYALQQALTTTQIQRLIAGLYLNNQTDPAKQLQKYYFKQHFIHDKSWQGVDFSH